MDLDATSEASIASAPTESAVDIEGRLGLRKKEFLPRMRQGVSDRTCVAPADLTIHLGELRSRTEQGDREAAATVAAICIGLQPDQIGDIPICPAVGRALSIDLEIGAWRANLDQIADVAAKPRASGCIEATREVVIPLPQFYADLCRAHFPRRNSAIGLREWLGPIDNRRGVPVVSDVGYRLRPTWTRLRSGYCIAAVGMGIHDVVAAQALCELHITTRSNLSYVTVHQSAIWSALERLFDFVGWGPPVAMPPALQSVGSLSTPTKPAATALFGCLRSRAENMRAGKNSSLVRLIAQHNSYVDWAASAIAFLTGARQCKELPYRATLLQGGANWFAPFDDKQTGATGLPRAMLLGEVVMCQLALYRNHLAALLGRLQRFGDTTTRDLQRYISATLACKDTLLFFHIDPRSREVRPVGTSAIERATSIATRLTPDAGRHYLATRAYELGLDGHWIDIVLRHASAGTEHMSSTSRVSLRAAWKLVNMLQNTVADELGIAPVPGLSAT